MPVRLHVSSSVFDELVIERRFGYRYCPFAMYIENENERLFTCLNEKECGKVSCRKCHKVRYPLCRVFGELD